MEKTWILVSNAHRARCFETDGRSDALKELADFIYPRVSSGHDAQAAGGVADVGKGHGRTGHAGTQFEPHVEAGAKERHSFARQLADYLNTGVAAQRCERVAMIATQPLTCDEPWQAFQPGELRVFVDGRSLPVADVGAG